MKLFSTAKNRVKTSLSVLVRTIKYYFYAPKRFVQAKYLALYEALTYRLLAATTVMVRTLIIRQGKNPDYVAPPLPPPAPTFDEVVAGKPKTHRPQLNIPYVPSWVRASFRTASAHPINKSRADLSFLPRNLPVPPVVEPIQVVLAPEPVAPVEEKIELTTSTPVPFEGEISVSDTGEVLVAENVNDDTVTYGFIKYGDDK